MPTTYERLDYGSTDGSQWGASTDALSFYGSVPVLISTVANVSSGTETSTTGDLRAVVSSLIVAFKRIGIIA